jgi:hypothetical protein
MPEDMDTYRAAWLDTAGDDFESRLARMFLVRINWVFAVVMQAEEDSDAEA